MRALCLVICFLVLGTAIAQPTDKRLERCLREQERPRWECWDDASGRVAATQSRLVSALQRELSRCEVKWAGYDAAEALRELQLAQNNWQKFVKHECNYGFVIFGQGTDAGLESLVCDMKLTARRNEELRKKLDENKRVKAMLKEWGSGFVTCPKE